MADDASIHNRPETPVELTTHREDQDVVYTLNIHHDGMRQQILDAYDAEDVDDLADQHLTAAREVVDVRLGVVSGSGDDAAFHTDHDLLTLVDGIDDELAAGLLDEAGDLKQLCADVRREGDAAVQTLLADAQVEGRDWAPSLKALLADLREERENFEQRLKDVDVWTEPDNVTADA